MTPPRRTSTGGRRPVENPLGLAVLSYLSERPMHPYELSRTLRDNGDARSIKFNHGSLYMVVGQLARAGLVVEHGTGREGQRPERTVYALTDAGRAELDDWLGELVEEPRHEYPAFVGALSLIAALPPDRVVELLTTRLARLAEEAAEARALVATSTAQSVPGLFLLEEEFRIALLEAEQQFVERLLQRIGDPTTDWVPPWAEFHARRATAVTTSPRSTGKD